MYSSQVCYKAYGGKLAFFVSNMVNVQYVLWGQLVLWYSYSAGHINASRNNCRLHGKIAVMALLDALAGFFAAMGAVNTSGALQQMLNQTLIPLTMFCGWLFLDKRPGWKEMIGAAIIFGGAGVVLMPQLLPTSSPPVTTQEDTLGPSAWLAALVYASSNAPKALASVYKEIGFKNLKVNVIYLTQWVSIYQLFWGILLMPLQSLPGMGSDHGMTMQQSIDALHNGWECFLHRTPRCKAENAFGLLLAYILVNFSFNLLGLYILKHGSSVLSAVSFSLILPLTVIAFALPVLGPFQEGCPPSAVVGLVVVLVGFVVWRKGQEEAELEVHCALSMQSSLGHKSATVVELAPVLDMNTNAATVATPESAALRIPEQEQLLPRTYTPARTASMSLPASTSPLAVALELFSPARPPTRRVSMPNIASPQEVESQPIRSSHKANGTGTYDLVEADDEEDGIDTVGFEERTTVLARAGWRSPIRKYLPRARAGSETRVRGQSK